MYEHLIHTVFVSEVANFELTEIKNIFKCFGGVDELKVRMLRGVPRKRTEGGRGPEIDEIELTSFDWPQWQCKEN